MAKWNWHGRPVEELLKIQWLFFGRDYRSGERYLIIGTDRVDADKPPVVFIQPEIMSDYWDIRKDNTTVISGVTKDEFALLFALIAANVGRELECGRQANDEWFYYRVNS